MGLAGCGLFVAIICLIVPNKQWAIILTILAAILGNYAFNYYEKAWDLKPASPVTRSLELFSAPLKKGNPCTILIELQHPTEDQGVYTLDRIRTRLQRALNIALADVEQLPANPYPFIDELLERQREPIAAELELTNLELKAVDIKTTPTESAPGVFLRET